MRPTLEPQRGVSLIEALVALAVMSFGMLGIVGVQSTLRLNSDVAKQRSEAVRLAQQAIEDARSFVQVALPPTPGVPNYGTVVGQTQVIDSATGYTSNYGAALPVYSTNTSYTLTRTVAASGDAMNNTNPRMKTVSVQVTWTDRSGANLNVDQGSTNCSNPAPNPNPNPVANECVTLNTVVARVMPELAGTLALAGNLDANGVPRRGAYARNPNIPFPAVNFGDGTSGYIPPGRPAGDTTAFRFDNATALITLCTTAVANNAALNNAAQLNCAAATAWPLSGTVNFATNAAAAVPADAVDPSGTAQSVEVGLTQSFPAGGVGAPVCYTTPPVVVPAPLPYVSYLCAVPVTATSVPASVWSGVSTVSGGTIVAAGTPLPVPVGSLMTCRYTGARANVVVPAISNARHPQAYLLVGSALSAQNFLIVPYVTGTAADCPDSAALLGGTTTYPQP